MALSLEIPNNFDIITELGNEDFSRHTYIDLVMPTFDEKTNTVTDSFGRNAFVSFVSYCHSYTYIKTIDVYWSESEKKIEYRFENYNVWQGVWKILLLLSCRSVCIFDSFSFLQMCFQSFH